MDATSNVIHAGAVLRGGTSVFRALMFIIGAFALLSSALVQADPPARVARLGYIGGAVSFSPAGSDEWVQAAPNRPIVSGDRLWADEGARDELQIGNAALRMGGDTSITLLNLDERLTQVQLTQGTLNVRVWQLGPDDMFEIDTPNLALVLRQPGDYRIDVDPDGDATTVSVRRGLAEVYGEDASRTINEGLSYRFGGTGLRDYLYTGQPSFDDFDAWSAERDRLIDNSISARYVSRDTIGYEDLDANGSWHVDAQYGNVWMPSYVVAGWAPYSYGHWIWIDPWGWTWVDDAPWGFAVSHYGRWAHIRGRWGWVPGPIALRPVYAPALVAFVGGSNFRLSLSVGNMVAGVGWFPLAPREVYRPSYRVSRGYFTRINASNTRIDARRIGDYYDNKNVANINYANRHVPGAVVAVSASVFEQSRPVGRAAVRLSPGAIGTAAVMQSANVVPSRLSLTGAATPRARPSRDVLARPVLARTPPPPAPVPFVEKRRALEAQPGRPLDEATIGSLKREAPAHAPQVRLLRPSREGVPSAAPVQQPPVRQQDRQSLQPGRSTPPESRGQERERAPEVVRPAPQPSLRTREPLPQAQPEVVVPQERRMISAPREQERAPEVARPVEQPPVRTREQLPQTQPATVVPQERRRISEPHRQDERPDAVKREAVHTEKREASQKEEQPGRENEDRMRMRQR
ncbi:proline-rich exported protein [Sulfurimicrobium lacus]|uniref:Proline-rich exported protein n=1 Tax=Sulfurimicrobium lacus TaxID=2715678 RepID=A0A6F8V8X3_9PROT|nr:DUF6600 domain-containing protein [Sulfurimicrobium lacus]BCB25581.1 proline-rich exported protein [Sulfurimicrobium lacus]